MENTNVIHLFVLFEHRCCAHRLDTNVIYIFILCHACMHGLIHDGRLRACQSCLLGLMYVLRLLYTIRCLGF
jgi:hypothetical protein